MERKTRIPTQKRALEKIEKVTDAAFKLFNEKGYYSTTTADIAKEAGVATGSVYAYFEDKKDIYIQVVKNVYEKFLGPTQDFWEENVNKNLQDPEVVKNLFDEFVKLMLTYHNFTKIFHDELNALTLLDDDISNLVKSLEVNRIDTINNIFKLLAISFKSEEDSKLLLHYTLLLVDDACHRILYDNTVNDMQLYIDRCVDMISTLFRATTN